MVDAVESSGLNDVSKGLGRRRHRAQENCEVSRSKRRKALALIRLKCYDIAS